MARSLTALLVVAALVSCAPAPDSGWRPLAAGARESRHEAQLARAGAAREALFQALLGELTAAFSAGGPASAIGVCKEVAPRLARDVGAAQGVAIGRTSERLRSEANTAPAWAGAELRAAASGEVPATAVHEDGRLGALFPIRVAAPCLACHGGAADVTPEVAAALARDYPRDRATGYRLGDLRGWFWVEVPRSP